MEKDAALKRRFQPVLWAKPSVDDTIDVLRGLKDRYEGSDRVKITSEALIAPGPRTATSPTASSRTRP